MPPDREILKRRLFAKCDQDGDHSLNKVEMRDFASLVGFDGSDQEWSTEYAKLCNEHGVGMAAGIPDTVVMSLLDDTSDTGCYCTDQELQQLLDGGDLSPTVKEAYLRSPRLQPDGSDPTWVFFRGASLHTQEEDLRQKFEEAGQVVEFKLFRTMEGASRGSGRVRYTTPAETQRAIRMLDGCAVDGRAVRVQEEGRDSRGSLRPAKRLAGAGGNGLSIYQRDEGKTVYFAGASPDTTANFLRRRFAEFGEIVQFTLPRDSDNRSRGTGVVKYDTVQQARKALEFMNGTVINGKEITVRQDSGRGRRRSGAAGTPPPWSWSTDTAACDEEALGDPHPHSGRYKAGTSSRAKPGADLDDGRGNSRCSREESRADDASDPVVFAQARGLFFCGAPYTFPADVMRAHFEEHGAVESFNLWRLSDGRSRGMGECVYHSRASAREALRRGVTLEGRPLHLQDTSAAGGEVPLQRGEASAYGALPPRGSPGTARASPYERPQGGGTLTALDAGRVVFFSNVPPAAAEVHLWQLFESVGTVENIVPFTDEGKMRGMGIVEYETDTAAKRAYHDLYQRDVLGSELVVDNLPSAAGVDADRAIFFKNTAPGRSEDYLRGRFEALGPVDRVTCLSAPGGSGRLPGVGVVEYSTSAAAERAHREMTPHQKLVR